MTLQSTVVSAVALNVTTIGCDTSSNNVYNPSPSSRFRSRLPLQLLLFSSPRSIYIYESSNENILDKRVYQN
jgi:hypothetical protein